MLMKLINRFCLTAVIIFPLYSIAQDFSGATFADYLFREGEYYRAITEYHRILQGESDHQKRARLLKKIGLCYFRGEDYEGYISFMKKNQYNLLGDSVLSAEMNLHLGESYYHLNRYEKTISHLNLQQLNPHNQFYNDFQFLLAISYSRTYDWQNAINELQGVSQQDSGLDKIKADNMIRSFRNFQNQPYKSPFWAGSLSAIIPGSGYAYCHHWGTGIASLLVNGLLVWAFADALKQEQYGMASLTGFVGIGWYVGNIKGSVKAAKKYNSRIREDFINSILMREDFLRYVKN
jgi:tetratricopeptide (TPR) repeat protein